MTKQDWQRVKDRWFYADIFKFEVDGYQLTLQHTTTKTGQVEYMIYVNGWLKGKWTSYDCEERRRFMRKITRKLHSPKKEKEWRRIHKVLKTSYSNPIHEYYLPYWRSFTSFKRHLIANNQEIRLVYPKPEDTTAN